MLQSVDCSLDNVNLDFQVLFVMDRYCTIRLIYTTLQNEGDTYHIVSAT